MILIFCWYRFENQLSRLYVQLGKIGRVRRHVGRSDDRRPDEPLRNHHPPQRRLIPALYQPAVHPSAGRSIHLHRSHTGEKQVESTLQRRPLRSHGLRMRLTRSISLLIFSGILIGYKMLNSAGSSIFVANHNRLHNTTFAGSSIFVAKHNRLHNTIAGSSIFVSVTIDYTILLPPEVVFLYSQSQHYFHRK